MVVSPGERTSMGRYATWNDAKLLTLIENESFPKSIIFPSGAFEKWYYLLDVNRREKFTDMLYHFNDWIAGGTKADFMWKNFNVTYKICVRVVHTTRLHQA